MSDRAITITGVLLGATGATVGFLLTTRAIQNHRYPPAKPYSQADAVVTSIGNLKGARA